MRSPDSLLMPADPAATLELKDDLADSAAAVHTTVVTGAIVGAAA